ncbi:MULTISPECIES: class I SAM-dependent DNA methyltransferase [Deefgea]|uniref:site-specific DNA-methyltransferase (adenine-specific) n=1 Tax=Deefgea chitinilytica TaxID=570276 RepID=A0ABS2CG67_9NEIS|nr:MULTISPECIES: DNA methyltransferase [Deefgea]MBM5572423.1 N-6 DNA methylase [Deefgea chitinilytica]MBM9889659.1 class I SAM-dependent DNA methyltransferase [Deefgea sp. CFH1-16]
MTPAQFIQKWTNNDLNERAGAQLHFADLCELLGVEKPYDPENYCFERGASKTSGGEGWADVWKRDHFAWENKKPGRDLKAALKQLTDYALNLDNPPLLIVCDRESIEIHTAFTGYPHEVHRIRLQDLLDEKPRQILRWVFTEPEKLRPIKSTAAITEEAAGKFGDIAEAMRARDLPATEVAHFLIQCLFCMFAEDEGLLPRKLFTTLLEKNLAKPERVTDRLTALFKAMQKGGDYGDDEIRWFNGGLFKNIAIPALNSDDVFRLHQAALLDWRAIDPTIFGTLFERGLDPKKRSQLGAHYTDRASIMRIINPVIVEPLAAQWQSTRSDIAEQLAKSKKHNDAAYKKAQKTFQHYLEMLRNFRVLDPACGSGNFLFLALKALKDLEHRANIEAADLGLQRQVGIEVSPANVLGLELDPYAAELARVTVWIGEIQWMQANGYPLNERPLLKPLDHIQNTDALIDLDGKATAWPACDAIVGNPPFLGGSKKSGELGRAYFDALNRLYDAQVPGGADLVCYWFHKAREQIAAGQCLRAGLVSTQSIRNGSNRKVLDAIVADAPIFNAWSDEPWVNEGAAVRVSLVCFGIEPTVGWVERSDTHHQIDAAMGIAPAGLHPSYACLDGQPVARINADLTVGGDESSCDLTLAKPLAENAGVAFQGPEKNGAFDITGTQAREWLKQPNPHAQPNSLVLKPRLNGQDVTSRYTDGWIIDFGCHLSQDEAALFELPFAFVEMHVKPERDKNKDKNRKKYWWRFGRTGEDMRIAIKDLPRYIASPETAKHRTFVWLNGAILPDKKLIVIARADDTTFGIVHSRLHEVWSLAQGSIHGDGVEGGRPRYTPTTTFATFPFPAGLTPADTIHGTVSDGELVLPKLSEQYPKAAIQHARAIAAAAARLNTLRENWLNPPEWVTRIPEVVAGFPDRIIPKPEHAAALKKRTLTNLYNERPSWLARAHEKLDLAVAQAYGWDDYTPVMSDEEILRRLLVLNLARSHG